MHSGVADKAVRFRCCQLLASLTKEFTQRPQVGEEDLEGFVDVLLPRLRDKVNDIASRDRTPTRLEGVYLMVMRSCES